MSLKDFTGVVKKHQVNFIEVKEVSDGYYQVFLEKNGLSWDAGQHAIFTIDDHKISGKSFRPFSFATIEEENVIMLGTRSIGEMSDFKKTLFSLKKGEKVNIRGPIGSFKLKDETTPIVFIALGIGITPVRALLKEIVDKKYQQDIHLVYSSEGYFMFKEELENMKDSYDHIDIVYPTTIEETKKEIKKAMNKNYNDAYYYISGPPKVMKQVKEDLIEYGINSKQMLHDPFVGY